MRSQTLSKRSVRLALLLATAVAVPAATLALPTDAPDLNVSRDVDDRSVSTVWEQPPTPAPAIVVRPPKAQPSAPERALSPNPLWEIPLSSLSTTRERPIFSPSRRPPPPIVAAAAPAPIPPPKPARAERPQLSLVGTVDGGDESFGIFVDQTTKAAFRLRIGEDYRGWKLRGVHGREVTLERDQQTTTLMLPQPGAGALAHPPTVNDGVTAPASGESPPQQRDSRS
jgi:hypothetical protein